MYSDINQGNQQFQSGDLIRGTVRVVAIRDRVAWVEAESQAACGGCAAAKGCGTKTLSSYFSKKTAPLRMVNDFGGTVGDRIEVGIRNSTILKVSALIYLLPLLGLIVGALIGDALNGSDFVAMCFSLAGLLFGFYLSRLFYRSARFAASIVPVFLNKLPPLKTAERMSFARLREEKA